nr:MAG: nsp1a [Astroviridae sp.]
MANHEIGIAKLAPSHGAPKLYKLMKEKFGGTQKWGELMKCDSIIVQNLNTAYGYLEGDYFIFEATRYEDGWNLDIRKSFALPEEDKLALRAHSSHAMRLRMTQAQSSNRAATVLQLQDENAKLKEQLKSNEILIKQQKMEIGVLRDTVRSKHYEAERTVQVANHYSWTSVLVVVFALVLTMFANPAYAEDCTKPVHGCYLDPTSKNRAVLDFTQFNTKCFGQTTTRIHPDAVNPELLAAECVEHQMKVFGIGEWIKDWCNTTIDLRLHRTICEKKQFKHVIEDYILETIYTADMMTFEKFLPYVCSVFGVVTIFAGSDPFKTLPIYLLGLYARIPTFALSLALTLFPAISLPFLMLLCILPADYFIPLIVTHWLVSVIWAATVHKTMEEVSTAVVYSALLPCWHIGVYLLQTYSVGLPAQILLLAVTLTLAAGTCYAQSTVVITSPDGTTTKTKRVEFLKRGAKETLLRMQNAVRGIIPEIPDKTKCVARIESAVGSGVAFRFMNELLTIGHVIGPNDTAVVTWGNVTTRLAVKRRVPLFESADDLVFFKLPSELQGMKPLRLTRITTSDYMQCLSFDQSEIVTYTGWCIRDGYWLANSFNTKPGDSGAPYIDRHGRLVAIHLGTQGVVGQGYCLDGALKQESVVPLAPVNENPTPIETREPVGEVVKEQCRATIEQLGDELLSKLIEGTKKSFAQITSEMERLAGDYSSLKNICETKIEQQANQIKALENELKTLRLSMMITQANNEPVIEEKKKGKNKKGGVKEKFMKMKVLTEEQYKQMLEEGWSPDEIKEAVNQLREQAWLAYDMDSDDYTDNDEELQAELDDFLFNQKQKTAKQGKLELAPIDIVLQEAKRRIRNRVITCPACKNDFTGGHNIILCKRIQEGKNIYPSRSENPKYQRHRQHEKKDEEPKNGNGGRKGTSQ